MDLSVGLCVQVAAAMAVHARHSCWSRPEQAAAAVEQSACLFVVAASPSRRSSWRTRASTRTVVGMSIERWCLLNMVRLDRRSAHRVSTGLQRAVSSPRSSQPALPKARPGHHVMPHTGGFGDAALQTDGRPPSSSRPRPLVPGGWVHHICRESGARREWCGACSLRVHRAAATPSVTPSGQTPRRCTQRTARRWPGRGWAAGAPARSARSGDTTASISGARSSGEARSSGAAEPPVTHLLATRQGGPKHAVCSKRPAHADSFRHAVFCSRRRAPPATRSKRVPAAHAEQARGV